MAKVLIKAGAEIDVPTRDEVRADIHDGWHDYLSAIERQRARGVKPVRIARPGPTPAAGTLFLTDAAPESGYLWNVKILSVQLASAGTVLAYIASSAPSTSGTPRTLIANMGASSANQVTTWSSSQLILYPDEGIYLVATQNISAAFLAAAEVPAEMFYKIYD
jgi:hypothetical protein